MEGLVEIKNLLSTSSSKHVFEQKAIRSLRSFLFLQQSNLCLRLLQAILHYTTKFNTIKFVLNINIPILQFFISLNVFQAFWHLRGSSETVLSRSCRQSYDKMYIIWVQLPFCFQFAEFRYPFNHQISQLVKTSLYQRFKEIHHLKSQSASKNYQLIGKQIIPFLIKNNLILLSHYLLNIVLKMQLNPKIRNFKLKKLEKIQLESGTDTPIPERETADTITQIVANVLEKLKNSDAMFHSQQNLPRKHLRDAALVITNKDSTSNNHYHEQFANRMDPRDKLINVPFHFSIPTHRNNVPEGTEFTSSELFAAVSANIEDYLVRMLEVVVSISFNQLMEGKLKENECKDYASKNILLNVHAVCRETFRSLKERGIIDGREKEVELALTELADNTLTNAVRSLAPYYPQAPPSGGTPRIRQALLAIDRNHNSELDFLSTQNLTLERSADGDYTEYIMRVINRAILVTGEIDDDLGQRTLYEKFKDFMQNLIWLAKDESCIRAMSTIIENNSKKVGTMKDLSPLKRQESVKQDVSLPKRKALINRFFRQPTVAHAIQAIRVEGEKDPHITEESRERHLHSMKLNREVEMGQKLPSGLETFGNNDLKDRNFTAKHSSVLRVITKWAQNLDAVFENAEKFVLNRNYPFTTLAGRSVYPTTELKKRIFDQIMAVKEKKNKIHDELIAKNKLFQAEFLTKSVGNTQSIVRFIKRYTNTRMVASKMNTLIIRFMQEYLSALIGLLIEAGKFEQQNDKFTKRESEYINLISFRIGDLMRARMHVNQAACIRILHTLYLLDEHQSKENPFFKLVRVKNKLDKQDNNILINFLFRGKLQCELQLSSQKVEGKQQKYYAFSHFLYELSRGSFGILSECAIIISQHDPIVSSLGLSESKIVQKKKTITPQESLLSENDSNILICSKCSRLIIDQSKQIFIKKGDSQNICNQCFIKNFVNSFKSLQFQQKTTENTNTHLIQKHLSNSDLSQLMTQMMENNQIRRLIHYGELSAIKKTCLLFSINQKYNKIDYNLLIYEEVDTDWYIIHINDAVLLSSNDITDQDIEIKKLTAKIKQQAKIKGLTYIEASLNHINMADVIKATKKNANSTNFVNKLYQVEETVRSMIARSNIYAILQNKNETIAFNKNSLKMDVMNELAETASNINHIEYVFAQGLQLKEVPAWISKTSKLKLINLKENNIKNVQLFEDKLQLKELYLANNEISQINCNNLKNLEKLDIASNSLSSFVSQELPCLLELNLSRNSISKIDINFPVLKTLNLSNNGLKQLDTTRLPSTLQKLILSQNSLSQLPALPPNLKQLKINYNRVNSLEQQKLPKSLIILDACSNQLQEIKIEDMPNLLSLYVSENYGLKTVWVKSTPKLRQISIQNTQMETIENIEFPQDMQWIFLDNNKLKQVRLKNLKCLQILSLTGNIVHFLQLKDVNLKMLTLYSNQLTTLNNITIPKSVQQLFLKDNQLTSVILQDFPSLKIINLESNQLSSIDISNTPMLQQLALDNNCFNNFDNVRLPPSLKSLFVRANKLTDLNLSDLPQLVFCIMDNNPLVSISLRNMPKLEEVGLINTQIKSQADVDIPNTVKKIYLHGNQIQEIMYSNMPNLTMVMNSSSLLKTAKLQNLKNLDSIYLNNGYLTELILKKVPKLQKIRLSSNQLRQVALVDMPFLKDLILNQNKLTEIKLESTALIETLNISNNQLKQLKLKNMPMITSISADYNLIETCELQNLPSLQSFTLVDNQLKTISLTKLKSLTTLTLYNCPIQSIYFNQLKKLQNIKITGVKLKEWKVQNLPKLKQLTISGQLESIQFVGMDSLQGLALDNNKLSQINFHQLPNLQWISIHQNQFTQLNFSNLKELNSVKANNNKVKSAEFTNLPKLTNIVIENNKIDMLTLKDVPALTDLWVSSNQFKSIDTSVCKALTTLSVQSNPINSLQSLNIHNPSILCLYLNETQLETFSIKDYESLYRLQASRCQKLKQVVVENCQKLQYVQIKQNPALKVISIKEAAVLQQISLEETTPEKGQIINVRLDAEVYVSSVEVSALLQKQNPLQQLSIICYSDQ